MRDFKSIISPPSLFLINRGSLAVEASFFFKILTVSHSKLDATRVEPGAWSRSLSRSALLSLSFRVLCLIADSADVFDLDDF